jgi:Protein of unknown function (DUF3105)
MASGTKSKGASKPKTKGRGGSAKSGRSRGTSISRIGKPKPWGMIIGVIVIVLMAGGVFTYAFVQINEKEKYVAAEDNQDPSDNIDGVKKVKYEGSKHVTAQQRVAYDQSPPFGGPHDELWANCTGTVYDKAVRNENMVHALEHGSVWIAYNPDKVKGGALNTLKSKVEGQPYMMLSPYPGLDKPISLQSWGHQLKLDSADDERIDQFITSLRENKYQNPEPGGSCDYATADPTQPPPFDPTNPPPFVAEKPGKDAVTMDGKGAIEAPEEGAPQQQPPVAPPATGAATPPAGSASAPPPSR